MPTSSIHFTPSRAKNNGMRSMKITSDICPRVWVPAMFSNPAASRNVWVKL